MCYKSPIICKTQTVHTCARGGEFALAIQCRAAMMGRAPVAGCYSVQVDGKDVIFQNEFVVGARIKRVVISQGKLCSAGAIVETFDNFKNRAREKTKIFLTNLLRRTCVSSEAAEF